MPMRIYRASTKHVANNLWLWIAISAVAMIVIAIVDQTMPRGQDLGNWIALAGSFLGILLMMKSEAEMPAQVLAAID